MSAPPCREATGQSRRIQTKHQLQHELWAGNRMTTMALLGCFVPGLLGSRNGRDGEWPSRPCVTQVTLPPASAVESPWSYERATGSARTGLRDEQQTCRHAPCCRGAHHRAPSPGRGSRQKPPRRWARRSPPEGRASSSAGMAASSTQHARAVPQVGKREWRQVAGRAGSSACWTENLMPRVQWRLSVS